MRLVSLGVYFRSHCGTVTQRRSDEVTVTLRQTVPSMQDETSNRNVRDDTITPLRSHSSSKGELVAATPNVQAQTYRSEYKLSTVLPSSYPWGKAGERWAELVKEKTQGRINIKMYPGTSLVGGDQTRT